MMFTKIDNLETAFRHVKTFTMVVVAASALVSVFALYQSYTTVHRLQDKIYVLANGKAIEAYASDRRDNIAVEARDHVRNFHHYFFTLDPDDKVIRENVAKALYLADNSAKRVYDDLKEGGYYSGIISGNISQGITIDSIVVSVANYPYYFRCYAKQQIVRPTSILKRNLITEGNLRNVSRSDNNPHGFLIERWRTLDNKDIGTENRQ
ncbi:conjugative transposon protein TraK [Flavobacterium suaedae]|uniref:Conjugative transposon protein TraK n=1 Tax=Flavobacterium suaedae TaxID=1767027 RepID=A0ABQ1JBE6_9FLAO|nr:conjugative transposon protein TraK [Flavobacterium suaedae]GGB64664.1 conjugative transposon protein TraK [Flavobacterium suaedae]